jgi:hypothetical protein
VRRSVWLLITCVACGPAEWRPKIDAPPGIEQAAVLTFDFEGRFLEGTRLGSLVGGSIVDVTVGATPEPNYAVIVGYAAGSLPPLLSGKEAEPVRVAAPGDPQLPAPDFSGRLWLDRGEVELETPFEVTFELTTNALPNCPPLPELRLGISCAIEYCTPVIEQEGCRVVVDPDDACSMGSFELQIDAAQRVVEVNSSRTGPCAAAPLADNVDLAFTCMSPEQAVVKECLVELSGPGVSRPLTRRTFTFGPGPFRDIPFTYSGGVATTDIGVVVATYGERAEAWNCTDPAPSRFGFLDLERAQFSREIEAPPCVTQLFSAPELGGFLAIYGHTEKRVGYFDRDGNLTESHPLPGLRYVKEATREGNSLFFVGSNDGLFGPFFMGAFDLTTHQTELVSIPLNEPYGVAASADSVALVDDDTDLAYLYDRSSLAAEPTLISLRIGGLELRGLIRGIAYHPARQLFLVPLGARTAGLTVFGREGIVARTVPFGSRQAATAVIPLPDAPELLLLSFSAQGMSPNGVAVIDPSVPRYVDPIQPLTTGGPISTFVTFGSAIIGVGSYTPEITIIEP